MAFLTLAQLKTHLDIASDDTTHDTKLNDFIAFAEAKAYEVLARSDKQLIVDLVEAVEDLDGFDDIDIEVPDYFTTSAYADTFADALAWVKANIFPELDRDDLAELVWYDNMLTAAKEACLIYCKKAAMDAAIMGKHESFGVSALTVTESGKTLTTAFYDVRSKFEEKLLPYRKMKIV